MSKALLLLEDGSVYEGKSFGKIGTTLGEICFNTGMTGYQEIFSDPSYFGQIVIMTSVHIGNYGVNEFETESDSVKISGLICRNFSKEYSRHNSNSLQDYLSSTVGIHNVDTRCLVNHIRSKGSMNCIISSEEFNLDVLKRQLDSHPKMAGQNLSKFVSSKSVQKIGSGKYKIGVLDFGIKRSILNSLDTLDTECIVFPQDTNFETIRSYDLDGFFLSNGPGDPQSMLEQVDTVKRIISTNKPVFGICLGHQLIAQANGISTYKMLNGHRGSNHPVKNLESGKCEITSQNHGFCVSRKDIESNSDFEITHIHLNDDTVAGMKMKNKPVMSVQYHPEAGPGPNDSKYLFEKFIEMIKYAKEQQN